ncbi:MAG: hypothetical protein Q9225_003366 [Loekoesia sp. 1 TL-2023]
MLIQSLFLSFKISVIVFTVLFSLFLAYRWIRRDRALDSIPGPRSYPFIGTFPVGPPPHTAEVFRGFAREYGELFKFRMGWYNWVAVNSPEAMKELFDKQSISTSSKIPLPIADGVVTKGMRMFTMPYGPKWRTYRQLVHQLLSPKMTSTFLPTQEFEVKQLMNDLLTDNRNQLDFYNHIRRLSFSIVMTSTYGRRVSTWDHEDVHHAATSSKLLSKVSKPGAFIEDMIPPLARLPEWLQPGRKRALAFAEPILDAKMRLWNRLKGEVTSGSAPPSFGKELMGSDYKAQGLNDEDAAWIIGGLVEAGSETSSVTLHNLVLYLGGTPDAQGKIADELSDVDRVFDIPTESSYGRAAIKEILRLCPGNPFTIKRFTTAPLHYKGYTIPTRTVLLANTYAIHYDPIRYPDPHTFDPTRYIHHSLPSADYAAQANPYERDHYTFGVGRRICPASRLAENTLNLALANMLWAFEIRPPTVTKTSADGLKSWEEEAPVDLSDDAFDTDAFRTPKPFRVRFVPRNEDRARIVRESWEEAKREGYLLRGVRVSVDGVVRPDESSSLVQ